MSGRGERARVRLGILALTGALAGLAALAPAAGAHATLVGVEPPDGATLAAAPRQVQLRFSAAVSERFQRVQLLDARGRPVAGARLRRGADARTLVLDLPAVGRGTYELTWAVLAQGDGHVTDGAAVFGVGARPGAVRRDARAPSGLETLLRWLDLAAFAALAGTLGLALLLIRARPPGAAPALRRLRAAAAASAAGGLAVGVGLLVREAHGLAPALPEATGLADAAWGLLGQRWGLLWLAREALLAGLLGCALGLRPGRRTALRPARVAAAAAALAGALAVVHALGGHAAGAAPLRVVAAAVHVLAAAAWAGAVPAVALALWPRAGAPGASRALARACARPFAVAALASGTVLAASGLVVAGADVASVDALLTTDYGRTLVTKAALVAVAGALGVAAGVQLRRRAAGTGPPRLLVAEAGALASVLLAAAALGASPPPRGPEFAPPRPVRAPALAQQVGDLLVSATARPNRPGANVLTVLAVSSRRPAPGPVERVAVRVASRDGGAGDRAVLREVAPGRWTGGARLDRSGGWRMTVDVTRGGRRQSARFAWPVDPQDPARPVEISSRPLPPLLDAAAAGVLAAAAAALAAAGLRRLPALHPIRKEAT